MDSQGAFFSTLLLGGPVGQSAGSTEYSNIRGGGRPLPAAEHSLTRVSDTQGMMQNTESALALKAHTHTHTRSTHLPILGRPRRKRAAAADAAAARSE